MQHSDMEGNDRNDDPMTRNPRIVDMNTLQENRTTTDITINIQSELDSIIAYAEVPLLPLVKACAPLFSAVHDLSAYVQQALHETPEQPPNGLTVDESAAIRLYTREWKRPHHSLYLMVNHTLRMTDRQQLQPYLRYLKLLLTALVKLPCLPSQTVWRGIPRDVSADYLKGTRVTWWAFSSCTTDMAVVQNNLFLGNAGSRTLFSVEVINGRAIRAHSHHQDEEEILLLPGTHMIVQSQLTQSSDLHIIHLKQIVPRKKLLEVPFKGIVHIFPFQSTFKVFLFQGAHLYPEPK